MVYHFSQYNTNIVGLPSVDLVLELLQILKQETQGKLSYFSINQGRREKADNSTPTSHLIVWVLIYVLKTCPAMFRKDFKKHSHNTI